MNATAYASYKKADAQLNKVYKQLMTILTKKEKPLLIQAEKDWVKFRDSHCKFEASQYEGGSIQPLINYNCLQESTKKRIAEIKASIKKHPNTFSDKTKNVGVVFAIYFKNYL